jgi:hypothetical protein
LSGGTAHAAAEKEKTHRCSVCKRTFQSGQALGGHKRLHYEAKDKNADAATAALQNFDLNLPAEGAPPEPKRARTMLLIA